MIPATVSPEVQRIVELLHATPAGGTLTFREISNAIGRNLLVNRHLLVTARRIVLRDHGAVFFSERGVGVRRLKTEELNAIGHTARRRVRSSARRGAAAIRAVMDHANDVSPDSRKRAYTELSVLGVIEHISRNPAMEKIEKLAAAERRMTVAETSKAFLSSIGALQENTSP